MNNPDQPQEIIIIKRSYEGEEGHHGGAWKIAFADFMTAMMALFLVLWLINAANEETKRSVASYFNPVKLVDESPSAKGLKEPEHGDEEKEDVPEVKMLNGEGGSDGGGEGGGKADKKAAVSDAEFFSEPFAVLDDIATTEEDSKLSESSREGVVAMSSSSGNPDFADPFSPNFWTDQVDAEAGLGGSGEAGKVRDNPSAGETAGTAEGQAQVPGQEKQDPMTREAPMEMAEGDVEPAVSAEAGASFPAQDGDADSSQSAGADPASVGEGAAEPGPAATAAEQMREKIELRLAEALGQNSEFGEEVSVTAQDDNIVISLTDDLDIAMFGVGSAVPSRDLVLALENIGGVLADQEGTIRVRGHTDARPFKSQNYDNWRLSSARAQSAYYMLVRGGLDENRVEEISGLADRQLLTPDDPLSPQNRRIEVLVEVGAQ